MKTRIVALLLAWFCGFVGFNNFYLNQNFAGKIKAIVFIASFIFACSLVEFLNVLGIIGIACLVVWTIFEFFTLASLTDEEFNKLYNK